MEGELRTRRDGGELREEKGWRGVEERRKGWRVS